MPHVFRTRGITQADWNDYKFGGLLKPAFALAHIERILQCADTQFIQNGMQMPVDHPFRNI